jgi:hypothetical protein
VFEEEVYKCFTNNQTIQQSMDNMQTRAEALIKAANDKRGTGDFMMYSYRASLNWNLPQSIQVQALHSWDTGSSVLARLP